MEAEQKREEDKRLSDLAKVPEVRKTMKRQMDERNAALVLGVDDCVQNHQRRKQKMEIEKPLSLSIQPTELYLCI